MILVSYKQKIEHYADKEQKVVLMKYKILLAFVTILSGSTFFTQDQFPLHNLFFIIFLAVHTYLLDNKGK